MNSNYFKIFSFLILFVINGCDSATVVNKTELLNTPQQEAHNEPQDECLIADIGSDIAKKGLSSGVNVALNSITALGCPVN